MYYLCEKYYKPITVQYYVADCVSWVPRLSVLDLETGITIVLLERNSFVCRGLTVYHIYQFYMKLRNYANGDLTIFLDRYFLPPRQFLRLNAHSH